MDERPRNIAIMDAKAPEKLLAAALDDLDWGIAWCCVREGMHPKNIEQLRLKNLDNEGWLQWIRVKNEAPRRTLVDVRDRPRLSAFLAMPKPARVTIWRRAAALCVRAGLGEGGPRVLRKTFILNELRRLKDHPDRLDLVAIRAGCKKDTVLRYYLDLLQWEGAYSNTSGTERFTQDRPSP